MKILTVITTGLAISSLSIATGENTKDLINNHVFRSSNQTTLITLDKLKAFPTAEGAGANSKGGRDGEVIYVTNHKASGEGSLRWALNQQKPRTILFAVGGRFNINENIRLRGNHSNVTLAGQTANDIGGVHLAQSDFNICNFERALTVEEQNDIVFRYFDSRYNWQYLLTNHDTSKCISQNGKHYNLSGQKLPTLRFIAVQDLIIDHVSSGWSSYGLAVTNKNQSNVKTGNISIQRSLMHENIINPNGQNHNIGMLLGTKSSRKDTEEQWNNVGDFSVHKNAFIGESHRFPNTAGGDNAKFRVVNNYVYGFNGDGTGGRLSRIGGNSKNDFVNNVYQEASYGAKFIIDGVARKGQNANNLLGFSYGGFLPMKERDGLMKTPDFDLIEKPNFYIDGNLFLNDQGNKLDMTSSIQSDPTLMTFRYFSYGHDIGYWVRENGRRVYKDDGLPRKEFRLDGQHLQLGARDNLVLRNNPLSMTDPVAQPVSLLAANDVKTNILDNVGGNVRFHQNGTAYIDDPIDRKYIDWAKNYSGPHSLTKSLEDHGVGSHKNFVYPNYKNGSRNLATYDTDRDGMPNAWEISHGLNPNSKKGDNENNAIRSNRDWEFGKYLVRNNAAYTNLEMYLADVAGDFHMLAKTEGTPINSTKDDIKTVSMPSTVMANATAVAYIKYTAKANRRIRCFFRKNSRPWTTYAVANVNVTAGSSITKCHLKIPSNIPNKGEYQLYTYITTPNGKWSARFDEATKKPIKITSFKDKLTSVNISRVLVAGETIKATVNYSAINKRDIRCFLQKVSTRKTYAEARVHVYAGTGTAKCNLKVPANIPKQGSYQLYTYITKNNGKWSERFDEEIKASLRIMGGNKR